MSEKGTDMQPHARPRGLSDLRTLAGRSDAPIPVYKAYLRISFLELERARHAQEMRAARHRLGVMDARCRQIEAETAEILASVAGNAPRAHPVAGTPRTPVGRHPSSRSFRLSY